MTACTSIPIPINIFLLPKYSPIKAAPAKGTARNKHSSQNPAPNEIAIEVNESVKEIIEIKEKEIQAHIENEFWTVQLGSYRDLNNAKGEIVSLRDLNFNAYIKEDKVGDVSEYKVRVGSELTRNMAEEISSNLKMNNYENQLVPYN